MAGPEMFAAAAISPRTRRRRLAAVVSVIAATTIVMSSEPATADVTAAQGLAFNYWSNVGLFGGAPTRLGYGQAGVTTSSPSYSPSVACPLNGGTATATDPNGARGVYGPAVIYGGLWPDTNNVGPPSGPQTSRITCQYGAGGFVTASTDVALNAPGTTWTTPSGAVESWPGGVGPDPFHADSVRSECRDDEIGRNSSTAIVNGQVVTSTDPVTGERATVVNIPTNPAPNTRYHGTLDHINPSGPQENFDLIINEQILRADGSITVNAAHMFLNGPIAVGEVVIGSVTCGPLNRPTFKINDVTAIEGDAGTQTLTFAITRSGSTTAASSVVWSTLNGSAVAPSDYTAVAPTTVSFAIGETTKSVSVIVNGDTAVEGDETFNVRLTNPVGAIIADNTGVGRITNNDSASFAVNDVSVTEGNSGTTLATFTVTRAGNVGGPASVKWSTINGTATAGGDYVAVPATTLNFAVGETTKTASVTINGDTAVEPSEYFYVSLASPTGATISDTTGIVRIMNDDTASLSVNDVTVTEGNAGTTQATFTISRTGSLGGASSVNWFTANGTASAPTDYTAVGATTVNFAAGETTKTVAVTIKGDTAVEAVETFEVRLATPVLATIVDGSGLGRITNDDAASLSVNDVTVSEGSSGTTAASFTISRSGATGGPASVQWSTADGTAVAPADYVAVGPTTVTFLAGETTKTVTVTVNGDTAVEAIETFLVRLASPANASILDGSGLGRINNDD